MNLNDINKHESQVRSYVRTFPVVFHKAVGSIIYDTDEKEYIDLFSGAGGLNYGHNNPEIKRRMIDYLNADGILHSLDMATEAKINFIDTFYEKILKPRKMNYRLQFVGPTGTNAVEAALKLSRLFTKRSNVIAFTHAFHGVSLGSLAATSSSYFRNAAGVSLNNITFIPYDGYMDNIDSAEYLEKILNDPSSGVDKPAAIILESIQGEGGVNVASVEWLKRVCKIAKKNEVLLIVDDIQAGCGRSGDFFSFEESDIEPDIIVMSKSISGSGLPMSLVLIRPDLDIWLPGQHNGTFRGNNLAFVSAKAAIDIFWSDRRFSNEIQNKGMYIRKELATIASRRPDLHLVVRGRGMLNGLSFGNEHNIAKKIQTEAFKRGLVVETCGAHGEVLKIMPALTIDKPLLDKSLLILSDIITNI